MSSDHRKSDRNESPEAGTSLVFRLKENDPQAWNDLVELYSPLIFSWCRTCNLDSSDAADVMQNVFENVSRKISQFQIQSCGTFRGWLWKVTQNKIRDFVRSVKNREAAIGGTAARIDIENFTDGNTLLDSGDPTSTSESHQLLHRALSQIKSEFSERSWAAFWRTVVDEVPTDITAEELGVSTSGVRQAKRRVLRRLRLQLGDAE